MDSLAKRFSALRKLRDSLDGREGWVEPILMQPEGAFCFSGFDKCRRYQMPDYVEPFQPAIGSPPEAQWLWWPGAVRSGGCSPFGDPAGPPHCCILWQFGLGDAGEHHADDVGAFRRPYSP